MNAHRRAVAQPWALRPVTFALTLGCLAAFAVTGTAPDPALGATEPLPQDAGVCRSVPANVTKSHQINVVLDDSGSMFQSPSPERWSYVKYALMVFAAMLGPTDEMKVFLLSQRGDVALTIKGSAAGPSQANVDAINALQMQGGGTPWAAVPVARDDLAASAAESRWLVVLSDGEFDDHVADSSEFSAWSQSLRTSGQSYDVGFLGAGSGAPQLGAAPGFVPANAPDDVRQILNVTANLANQIFGRAQIFPAGGTATTIDPDIGLASVLVLAQGDATIGTPMGGPDEDQPFDLLDEPVSIPLPTNPPALADGVPVDAVPASGLTGQVATVDDLPAGPTHFNVGDASTTTFYYAPRVQFGVMWVGPDGRPIPPGEAVVEGRYEIRYGFMDADCELIGPDRAELLGDITLSASMRHDGEDVAVDLESGATYELSAGDIVVTVDGTYLGGNPAHAEISQHIYPAPEFGRITIDDTELAASRIGAGGVIHATYTGAGGEPISAQEWAAIEPGAFTVTSDPDAGIVWSVEKGPQPGALILTPTPADGSVYSVDTAHPIELVVATDYVFDEGIKRAEGSIDLAIVDDLSWWDRVGNWFATEGWKWTLGLLGLILLIGYLIKRRFSGRFKSAPHINARARTYGMPSGQSRGEFKRSIGHMLLPYAADRATLRYAPGTAGFTRLKLKASGNGAGEVTNWKSLVAAHRPEKSVEVNGTRFDKDMTRPPRVGPGSVIVAQTPDMKYECTPNS